MGNVATLRIEADESGSVTAMNNLTGSIERLTQSLDKAGSKSSQAFGGMSKDHQQARQSAQLLANMLGIQVPRAIEQVITQSAGMRAALIGALNITSQVGLAIFAIQQIVGAIEFVEAQMRHFSDGAREREQEFANIGRQIFHDSIDGIKQLQEQTAEATAGDVKKIQIKLAADLKEISEQIQSQEILKNEKTVAKLQEMAAQRFRLAQAQEIQAQRAITDQTVQLRNQAKLSALTGADAIIEKMNEEVAAQRTLLDRELIDRKTFAARKIAIEKAAQDQINRLQLEADVQGIQAQDQAEAGGLAGQAQLLAQYEAEIKRMQNEEFVSKLNLNNKKLAAETDYKNKSLDLERQRLDELKDLESETAIAILPPWQRADAQIVADTEKRVRQVRELMQKDAKFEAQGQQEITLIYQQEMAKRVENMAGQLQNVFDEITSGGIGQFFKKQFEHLVFQMVASWILGVNQMKAASAGAMSGGGGGLLSILFGGGGNGPGGTPTFLGRLFGGGGSAVSGGSGGGGSLGLGTFDPFSNSGTAQGAVLSGIGLSAGQGALPGGVLPAGAKAGGGGLTSAAGLAGTLTKIFPNGLKIGSSTISGAQLATLGIGLGIFGEQRILKGGIGNALLGIGSDFLGGAAIGFAVGGPFGAAIGAAVGTLVGVVTAIFGGIFGEHKGDKARKQVMEPLTQQIKLVKDSYDVFQTDYNSGVSELEQLRTDALSKLKSIGGKQVKGNSAMVGVMIGGAETYLKNTEAERARRSQINFGPAQFHEGGFVRGGFPAIAGRPSFHWGGEVNANLLTGEGVLNRSAMSRIGEAGLNRMNAGGSSGDVHIHLHAIDGKSTAKWLRDGGGRVIVQELDRASRHGGF